MDELRKEIRELRQRVEDLEDIVEKWKRIIDYFNGTRSLNTSKMTMMDFTNKLEK